MTLLTGLGFIVSEVLIFIPVTLVVACFFFVVDTKQTLCNSTCNNALEMHNNSRLNRNPVKKFHFAETSRSFHLWCRVHSRQRFVQLKQCATPKKKTKQNKNKKHATIQNSSLGNLHGTWWKFSDDVKSTWLPRATIKQRFILFTADFAVNTSICFTSMNTQIYSLD